MRIQHKIQVQNEFGLHARPATQIAKLLETFKSSVSFTHNSKTVDAKQVMELLLLEAKKDAEIYIELDGDDAKYALKHLIDAFENQFQERM